jgi:glyoxylase-like metal-dependent hydrolase (beta-lactamase superfamily II)
MGDFVTRVVVGPLSTNCWLYRAEGQVYVIDPGADAEAVISAVSSLGAGKPAAILLTHGHFDHSDALAELANAYSGITVEAHRADEPLLKDKAALVTRFFDDNDEAGPFTVFHTPGHSPGSVSFYHEAEGVLFSGDTLFYHAVGRTDLWGSSPVALEASLTRLLALPPDTRVFPGHGPETTIGGES